MRAIERVGLVLFGAGVALLLMAAFSPSRAATIGIEQPDDGTKYALLCESITSTLLVQNGDVKWGGLPTYVSVKDGARVEECPMSQGNWFEFKTEKLRNYVITARLIRYDKDGKVLSNKLLSPYFYFHGPKERPEKPVVVLSV